MVSVSDGLVLRCNSFTGLRYARKRTSFALYRRWLCRGNVFPYFSPVRLEANLQRPPAFWLSLCVDVRLDEPQPLVDAARHLGEQVGRVQVAQFVCLVDGLPRRL